MGACLAAADCRGPLAIGVWFFIAIAWVISLGLSRDILKPSAATTTAFLDLSIRRCRHRLQALFADAVLFVMILAFDLVWIYHYHAEMRPMEPAAPRVAATFLRRAIGNQGEEPTDSPQPPSKSLIDPDIGNRGYCA